MEINYKQFNLEIKNLQNDGSFEGYVAVYNNIDFGNDVFDSKAFDGEDLNKFFPLLADHDTKKVIGKFRVQPDSHGLKMVDAKFNLMRDELTKNYLVPLAAEKYANLKNGDISGFSVGYGVSHSDCESKSIENKTCRLIKKATLMEGSVVTFPMNDKARLESIKSNEAKEMKSLDECASLSDMESFLKQLKLGEKDITNTISKTIISKVKEFSNQRDAEEKKALREVEEKANALTALTSLKELTNFINQNNK